MKNSSRKHEQALMPVLGQGVPIMDRAAGVAPGPRIIPVAKIKQAVARRFDFSVAELDGPCRKAGLSYARHLAIYLCRCHTIQSLPGLGRLFGDRDHSTIHYAVKRIDRLKNSDPAVRDDLAELVHALSGGEQGTAA